MARELEIPAYVQTPLVRLVRSVTFPSPTMTFSARRWPPVKTAHLEVSREFPLNWSWKTSRHGEGMGAAEGAGISGVGTGTVVAESE